MSRKEVHRKVRSEELGFTACAFATPDNKTAVSRTQQVTFRTELKCV